MLLLTSAILATVLFFSVGDVVINQRWFSIGDFSVDFTLHLDTLSRMMIFVVTVVSFLVHLYSAGYMAGDTSIKSYFAMLGFFTFAMLGIVAAGNLLLLFVFWELVGFSSYLLIGHWMEKSEAGKAAQKAFLFNRIGDAALLLGIILVAVNAQTFSISEIVGSTQTTLGGILIFCGVIAKSAQLPLFSWLPDAMEGPTPVSALLHAATMVVAGIFLLIRLFPAFNETVLLIIAITGALTSLFAAVAALNQFDIKKILAYSTISQLGLMVTAGGIGAKDAALLHLFTHAFFKAGLFLGAGSIIHALHHYQQQTKEHFDVQDIRNLGGLKKSLPFTFIMFCIASASLVGIPFFSGFLSKDSILAAALSSDQWIWVGMILLVSILTTLYTFRMIWFIFFGRERKIKGVLHESPWIMRVPILFFAIASGWFIVSINPINATGWFTETFPGIQHSTLALLLSSGAILVALIVAWSLYAKKSELKANDFIQSGFGLDVLYQKTIGIFVVRLSSISEVTDRRWIDGFLHLTAYGNVVFAHGVAWFDRNIIDGLVNFGAWLAGRVGSFTRSFQGGKIQLYIFWAIAGIIICLFFALI